MIVSPVVLLIAAAVIGCVVYAYRLVESATPRQIKTSLNRDQLDAIFEFAIASKGWSVADGGAQMIAHSPSGGGKCPQIQMRVADRGEFRSVLLRPVPVADNRVAALASGNAVRCRRNAFLRRVRSMDAQARIEVA